MQYTNTAYKTAVQKLPQNYRMEIEVIFDAETEDLLYPLLCETGENLETEKGEVLEYAESAERIVIPPDDIFEAGFSEAVFLSTFCVGSSVTADFWVRIFNKDGKYKNDALAKAEIRPRVTLYDETGAVTDSVPVGVFLVNQITVQDSDLRLECRDKMTYLNKPFEPQGVETSLYALGRRIAQKVRAGFKSTPLNLTTSPGKRSILSQKVNDSIFKGYSYAQVLSCIAEVCGSFAVFDNDGDLSLRWFKASDVTLTGDSARKPLELNGNTFSMDGNIVQVTGVNVISEDTELARVGTDKYLLTLNENPIANAMPETAANAVLYRLKNTKYIPCRYARIGGDPSLQVGDIVTVIDNKEPYNEADYDSYDKYPLYMTSRSWTYNCGGFSDTYCAAGNAERDLNTDRGMTQSKRISRLAKRITEADNALSELTDRETALLLFNEQMFNSMGLYKTVKDRGNGGVIVYYHDKTELENSGTIYMFGTSGFAWTTDGWNDGEPLWNYGFTGAGDAILNTIHAYMISADLIKTGLLQSQNGASWINMDDGTFSFRSATPEGLDLDTGEAIYSYEDKLTLDENGTLGVYGELRSIQSNYSAFIGSDADYDAEVDGIGIPVFRLATNPTHKDKDVFQIADSSFEDYDAVELRFPFLATSTGAFKPGMRFYSDEVSIVDSNTECFRFGIGKTGYTEALISNDNAKFGVLRDTISVSGNHLQDIWFNFYEPYSNYTTKYHFGTGYQQGYATLYAAGFNNVSDPELKENIKEVSQLNAIEKIKLLKFYSYDYKGSSDIVNADIQVSAKRSKISREELSPPKSIHTDIGIMWDDAPQEIQSTDGKAIDLYAYINLLAKSVQELATKNEELEARIKHLESLNQN